MGRPVALQQQLNALQQQLMFNNPVGLAQYKLSCMAAAAKGGINWAQAAGINFEHIGQKGTSLTETLTYYYY